MTIMNHGKQKPSEPQAPEKLLCQYCKTIPEWPKSWAIANQDTAIGHAIVKELVAFLVDRIQKGRAESTIKMYAGYLWALGGELIRQINYSDVERKLSAKQLILKYVNAEGGPYWRHARDELDHEKYDSVCKGLYKFMTNQH